MRRAFGLVLWLGLAALARAGAADAQPYSAVAAPEWSALFDRRAGWTGADGAYSIPLSADERPGSAGATRTLWLFGDTFVGRVRADGSRSDTTMVNNSVALLDGGRPDPAKMRFPVRRDGQGAAQPAIRPRQDRFPGDWFWPTDGVAVGDTVYVYTLRMRSASGGSGFGFATDGAGLVATKAPKPGEPPSASYVQRDMPLFVPASEHHKETVFGIGLMPNTETAGAPHPDGYLYIYGTQSGTYVKSLVVARVPIGELAEPAAYSFWDGAAWQPEIGRAAAIAHGVSAEASVTPLADGRFLMVHMLDLLGSTVQVRYGASPVGPWSEPIPVWECPEKDLTADTWVYGAKAHPHLSRPGELLISYSVNSFDFAEQFGPGGAEIYRPRFIRLPLP